jgi:hypothetical protein
MAGIKFPKTEEQFEQFFVNAKEIVPKGKNPCVVCKNAV